MYLIFDPFLYEESVVMKSRILMNYTYFLNKFFFGGIKRRCDSSDLDRTMISDSRGCWIHLMHMIDIYIYTHVS